MWQLGKSGQLRCCDVSYKAEVAHSVFHACQGMNDKTVKTVIYECIRSKSPKPLYTPSSLLYLDAHASLPYYTDLSCSNVVRNASKTVMGIMRGEVKRSFCVNWPVYEANSSMTRTGPITVHDSRVCRSESF
jgi:hypothetical protein